MNKSMKVIDRRKRFITLALKDTARATCHLRTLARQLDEAKTIVKKVEILTKVLYLSESTIYNDINQYEEDL